MESDSSENNIVINTNKDFVKRFLEIYKNTIILVTIPILFLPLAFLGDNNAYLSFYIFIIYATYTIGDLLHAGITALIPVAFFTLMGACNKDIINAIHVPNSAIECLSVMAISLAVEHSKIHKRIALKILLICGCSHFRLSFLLFFSTMVLSMWFTNTMTCGLMMPLVKAILVELEKLGLMEIYQEGRRKKHNYDDKRSQKPTDFAIFYFLGTAYSSSIGGIATLVGSETNQILKNCYATMFPLGPKIEFPQFMLLTLPGVLIIEMSLYLWLNFYFLGMLRVQNYTALQVTLTGEEAQYITMLLESQYELLGKIKFHEMVVSAVIMLTGIFQVSIKSSYLNDHGQNIDFSFMKISAPCIICAVALFLLPADLKFVKFFRRHEDSSQPLPTSPSRGCLTWSMLKNNLHWDVIFVIVGSNITFEALQYSKMTLEFEKFLKLFSNLPAPVLALIVVIFCKTLTEFAANTTVANCLLPHIAKLSVSARLDPRYLLMGATLSCCLPFHLITGTPANAMVAAYIQIPPRKMMVAGIGPSIVAVLTNLFTISVWSTAIWPDITLFPEWAVGRI